MRGIGFDATCSLVAVGPGARPLAVGPSNDPQRDIVVWMDHRALVQTERINATGHPVLAYVGGRISPEMETPKLLWLKENKPDTFHGAEHFFDLADYLTWRATGSAARSVCTITCKWTYLAHERRWDEDYFRTIGLGEFADEGFRRIGRQVLDIGEPVGAGLTAEAAADLGLKPGTPVGAALIDAHAGGVGTVSGVGRDLALIMGTSACAMAVTAEATFVEGVWGPYFGAMLPGAWLLEGGQSGYGAALDHLVGSHPGFAAAREAAEREGRGVLDHLEARAVALAGTVEAAARLAATLHVVPDHLGNRSPHADPHATGTVSGLTLAADEDAIVRLFVAALCGLCYGTRDIVEAMRRRACRWSGSWSRAAPRARPFCGASWRTRRARRWCCRKRPSRCFSAARCSASSRAARRRIWPPRRRACAAPARRSSPPAVRSPPSTTPSSRPIARCRRPSGGCAR